MPAGEGGRTWYSGRTERAAVVANGVYRGDYRKTDCQHTANGGGERNIGILQSLRGDQMNLIYRDITKIRRRQRNIKGRLSKIDRKLAAHEGGGEGRGMGHKNIAESQGGIR